LNSIASSQQPAGAASSQQPAGAASSQQVQPAASSQQVPRPAPSAPKAQRSAVALTHKKFFAQGTLQVLNESPHYLMPQEPEDTPCDNELSKYVGTPKCVDCGWKLGSDITNNCWCRGKEVDQEKYQKAFDRARQSQKVAYQQETERPKRDCPKCEEHNTLKKYKAGWACSYCFYHED
jgi:hypothetical protein